MVYIPEQGPKESRIDLHVESEEVMPNPDHEKNRAAWNEMVELHWDHPEQKRKEFWTAGVR